MSKNVSRIRLPIAASASAQSVSISKKCGTLKFRGQEEKKADI